MSKRNKNSAAIDLDDNAIIQISEALLIIFKQTQDKIKSITFQDNIGILNVGSGASGRIQIQLPSISTLKLIHIETEKNENEKVIINPLYNISYYL